MKTRTSRIGLFASLGAASLVALSATAQTPAPATTAPSTPAPTATAPVKLPYGADDVLKLSRAQVSEDVTLNFIRNSGTIYNLAPKDIVYLRNEGVSDRVINTMLDQRKNVPAEMAAQPAPQAPAYPDANAAAAAQASAQYAPTYVQPAPVYTQPEPTYVPASTVYVIPYSSSGYGYPRLLPLLRGLLPLLRLLGRSRLRLSRRRILRRLSRWILRWAWRQVLWGWAFRLPRTPLMRPALPARFQPQCVKIRAAMANPRVVASGPSVEPLAPTAPGAWQDIQLPAVGQL